MNIKKIQKTNTLHVSKALHSFISPYPHPQNLVKFWNWNSQIKCHVKIVQARISLVKDNLHQDTDTTFVVS